MYHRFYTTVAIHQLAKEGYLNVSHPVRSTDMHTTCASSMTLIAHALINFTPLPTENVHHIPNVLGPL